jgi:hypothetical protein
MDKNALEQLLSSYNWWMGVSTIAVAVGILGEYVAHFVFEEEARRNRREMAVSILFGVLVLGGVVGEYVFGKKLTEVSEQLQQIADVEVAQSNKDAAAARKDAELARTQSAATYERAAQAEQHAAQENARAAKALETAEVARKNAEGFRLQIAQANERAANAERETARLSGELADRTLTDEQVRSIADKLSLYPGQEYDVTMYRDSKESVAIAERINLSLQLARWNILPSDAIGLFGGVVGVLVWRHPAADERTKAATAALIGALLHEGLQAELRIQNPQNNPKHNKSALLSVQDADVPVDLKRQHCPPVGQPLNFRVAAPLVFEGGARFDFFPIL